MPNFLKGYTIPSPGAGDGEYGALHGCRSCGMHGFDASPAEVPYWATQNLMRSVPALNGFGDRAIALTTTASGQNTETSQPATDSSDAALNLGAVAVGAALGFFFGRNPIAVMLGAGAGYMVGKGGLKVKNTALAMGDFGAAAKAGMVTAPMTTATMEAMRSAMSTGRKSVTPVTFELGGSGKAGVMVSMGGGSSGGGSAGSTSSTSPATSTGTGFVTGTSMGTVDVAGSQSETTPSDPGTVSAGGGSLGAGAGAAVAALPAAGVGVAGMIGIALIAWRMLA